MPAVTLKNFPPDLYDEIKRYAEINYRSIDSEILFRLKKSVDVKKNAPQAMIAKIEERQARIKDPELTDEILTKAKNEGRP